MNELEDDGSYWFKRIDKSGPYISRSRTSLEEELGGWGEKFRELAEAARDAGFTTVTIIAGHDPISHDDWRSQGYCGSHYMAIGAMELYLAELKSGE